MERDTKGRFTKKNDDDLKIVFGFPSIKRLAAWSLIFIIIMPWLNILWKFSIIKKVMDLFDELILTQNNETDGTKKSGIFY